MRISALARHLPLLLAFTSPALLLAQFQQPTSEELKMTDDPKAPGAAAVYLNVEQVINDPYHYQTFYARIKVLTEKGKELATVEIPYERGNFSVVSIEARTIHADGKVIPLTGKPEDLLIAKIIDKKGDYSLLQPTPTFQFNRKVFTLPSVEVGSILEYRYRIQYDEGHVSYPHWDIQRPYFVRHAHYHFVPFMGFLPGYDNMTAMHLEDDHDNILDRLYNWSSLPADMTIKPNAAGQYTFDLNDIPPIPDEESMPPIKNVLYHVYFYYVNGASVRDYWINESKRWSREVDHFAEPSQSIKNAVAGLIALTDTDLDKAKKLYKAVQALDNTDYSRKKTESEMKQLHLKTAKRAEDTWAQKSGTSEDIALLYLAMLRAAGLTAYDMKVVDRNRATFSPGYLNFDQLDDDIVFVTIAGKEILLDPGEKMCPFQTVNWNHSGASGLRQSAEGPNISTSPLLLYTANTLMRGGDLNLDAQGAVTGDLQFVLTGQKALYWRQAAIENDLDEIKKQFNHYELESIVPEGVEAHVDHFLALDDPDANLIAYVTVHGTMGAATSKRLMLPAFFFETRGGHPFVNQEKRLMPVDMHYAEQVHDQITYHLPPGLTVEGAPQDNKIAWLPHAILNVKTVTAPGQITISRQLSRAFTIAKASEYQDLRGFYQKVAASDQEQLVLAKSAPASPAPAPASAPAPPAPKGN
jgi:hypothetical protein